MTRFRDRTDAGLQLARLLGGYRDAPRTLVLALPRGGVPVGAEVARALRLPLDVIVVRKLGLPGHEEYAVGAIAGGVRVVSEHAPGLPRTLAREQQELRRREQAYRAGRPPLDLHDTAVLLVDDGLATGLSMRAAIMAARSLGAPNVVVAVPVGDATACAALRKPPCAEMVSARYESSVDVAFANDVVCVNMPHPFVAVGCWYDVFDQTSDEEVRRCLSEASRPAAE